VPGASEILGPEGPFPAAPLSDPLERRWLHYAFFSRDGRKSLIANVAFLGGDRPGADPADGPAGPGLTTAVLLMHDAEAGWACSEWNCGIEAPLWSGFRNPDPRSPGGGWPAPDAALPDLALRAVRGTPAVSLRLRRTSTPCASQCATFANHRHFMRWQSEPGVLADGRFDVDGARDPEVQAVGYHERVRGRWGWPEMGGWVFGFCNDLGGDLSAAPPWSVVFTLLQPRNEPTGQSASVMVWRHGKLLRHIPRKQLRVSVAGQLDRDRVEMAPALAWLLGTPAAPPIPAVLCIAGYQGHDQVELRFYAERAARLVIPSETSLNPFSVHEVLGTIEARLDIGGEVHSFSGPAVVEFAGGAAGPSSE
jgi:hypothetical protein